MTIAATRSRQFDPTPVRVVFTVPKDANAWTTKGHGWKRSGTHAVFGSAWATRAKGEALIATVTDATQLALVVGRSPHAGRVKVFLGGRLVGVVSLKGGKGDSAIVPLAPFPAARSGKLRIVTANALDRDGQRAARPDSGPRHRHRELTQGGQSATPSAASSAGAGSPVSAS